MPPLPLPVEPPLLLVAPPPDDPRVPLFGLDPDVPEGAVVALPEGLPLPVIEEPDEPLVPIEEPDAPLVPIEEPDVPLPPIDDPDVPLLPIIAAPALVSVVVGPAPGDMPVEVLPGEPFVGDEASLLSFPHPTATVAHRSAMPILIFMMVPSEF